MMRIKHLVLGALLALLPLAAGASPEPPWNKSNNCSGTITSGGTAQALANLPTPLHGIQIQNQSTDELAFSELTTSPAVNTNGSWSLSAQATSTAGGSYNSPGTYAPSTPIYIIGATTGDKFTCVAW